SKKIALSLTGAIARFSLTAAWYNDHFDAATIFFLNKNLHETEVAYLWLKKIVKRQYKTSVSTSEYRITSPISLSDHIIKASQSEHIASLSLSELNLLTRLAEMEPLSMQLVPLLAEIFTITQRSDFAAQKVFSIMKRGESSENSGAVDFGAVEDFRKHEDITVIKNIAGNAHIDENTTIDVNQAGSYFEQNENEQNELKHEHEFKYKHENERELQHEFEHEESYKIAKIDEITSMTSYPTYRPFLAGRKRRGSSIIRDGEKWGLDDLASVIKPSLSWLLSITVKCIIWLSSLPMNLFSLFLKIMQIALFILVKFLKRIHHIIAVHPELGKNLKRLIVIILAIGIVIIFANTLSHMFHTPIPPPPSTSKAVIEDVEVQVIPMKKFTIQIAAYLVKSHAEQYLKKLEKKGISGGKITSAEGGGKTWYLIRVGEYETKDDATAYGNSLKSQGIVKDFFVDNSGG
ncbi:MAG: SPOR domain-containing protein, partial [Desulfamplus sp.]|nr:SPOR domain-containing protein [Desulfamplus sp.]